MKPGAVQRVTVTRDLGLAVRGRRRELGLSQTALSEQAGVSRKWLSEFEQGKPSAEVGFMLRVLAAVQLQLVIDTDSSDPHPPLAAGTADLDDLLEGFGYPS